MEGGFNGPRKDCGSIVVRSRGKTRVVPAVPAFSRCFFRFVGCLERHDGHRVLSIEHSQRPTFDLHPSTSMSDPVFISYCFGSGRHPLLLYYKGLNIGQGVQHNGMLRIASPSTYSAFLTDDPMPEASGLHSSRDHISSHPWPRGVQSGHSTPPNSIGSLSRKSDAPFGKSTCSERDNQGFPFEKAMQR